MFFLNQISVSDEKLVAFCSIYLASFVFWALKKTKRVHKLASSQYTEYTKWRSLCCLDEVSKSAANKRNQREFAKTIVKFALAAVRQTTIKTTPAVFKQNEFREKVVYTDRTPKRHSILFIDGVHHS